MADRIFVLVSVSAFALSFLSLVCADDPVPVFQLCGASNFDVRNLSNTQWQFTLPKEKCLTPLNSTTENACQVTMTFCQAIQQVSGCHMASVCESYPNSAYVPYVLASYKNFTNPFNTSGLMTGVGFTASFFSGEEFKKPDNTTCTLTTVMNFLCNVSATWNKELGRVNVVPVTPYVTQTFGEKLCTYNFTFDFAGACPVIIPATKASQLSPGSILLMIFIVSVVMYFTMGCFINIARGKAGSDLIPHQHFWAMLPVYIMDGLMFTCTCGQNNPNATYGYESI